MYILTLQSYIRDTFDELDMLKEEVVMLEMRKRINEEAQTNHMKGGGSNQAPNNQQLPPGIIYIL
jgi:hypothetical protein